MPRPKVERWLLARLARFVATVAEGVRRGMLDLADAMDNRDARESNDSHAEPNRRRD